MHRNQIRRGQLALVRNRHPEDRELDFHFLGQTRALKSRPEPRSTWDDVARLRIPHPAHRAVECSRRTMRDARATNDPAVIAATRLSIAAYYEACARAAIGAEDASELSTTHTFLAVMKESSEAMHAVAQAQVSPSFAERAAQEVREMIHAGERHLHNLTRHFSRSAAL